MALITSGYERSCKDSIGGVKKVWLLKWQSYTRSQMPVVDNVLTSFPSSFVYEFESLTIPNANEQMQEDAGGKFYEQSISLNLKSELNREFQIIQDNDWRVLFQDNNGLYRIFGLYYGMQSGNIDYKTGGAKNEFNGYSFTLTAKEEKQSVFVVDPFDIGFVAENFYRITQAGDIRDTQDNHQRIYK
jgi:hypothetical protein